jgi:hypothetical protein
MIKSDFSPQNVALSVSSIKQSMFHLGCQPAVHRIITELAPAGEMTAHDALCAR